MALLVVQTDGEDVHLLYIHYIARVGCFYHWPLVEDQSWQDKTYVICIVPQPTYCMNSRDQLEFTSNVLHFVEKKTLERQHKSIAICIVLIFLILHFKKFQKCIYPGLDITL